LARVTLWAALESAQTFACSEQERPDRLPDLSGDDARRVLTGSFAAAAVDAGASPAPAGSGGASSCSGSGGAASCEVAGAGASGSSATGRTATTGVTGESPATLRQTYEAVCDDSTVQWGFFTYVATTPGDSTIGFRVRTAPTEDQLLASEYVELSTASTALGSDRCSFTGPPPCPIDLFDALGGAPLAHHPLSELEVVLNAASSDGSMPRVDQWQLNYSCTFNQ
jgi:hypothetical protein